MRGTATTLLFPILPRKGSRKEQDIHVEVQGPQINDLAAQKTRGGGLLATIGKGIVTIIVMGINAFCAAIATQIYKVFTKRWRDGGGSDIPVITTAPGEGSGPGPSQASTSNNGQSQYYQRGQAQVSNDFLNRYRD